MEELEVSEKNISSKTEGDDKLDLLLELLESGAVKSLDDLHNRLMPENPAETELIKRASLLRSFDENLFANALQASARGEDKKISFSEFTRNPKIEAVPRTEKIFRVCDDARQTYLEEWSGNRAAIKTNAPFIKKIVSYYETLIVPPWGTAPRYAGSSCN